MLRTFKADLFKALAHPVRIQILELLRPGELTVTELQEQLEIDMSSVSQQLAVLRSRQLVTSRKERTSAYYRVADPEVYVMLDAARGIFERHVSNLRALSEVE